MAKSAFLDLRRRRQTMNPPKPSWDKNPTDSSPYSKAQNDETQADDYHDENLHASVHGLPTVKTHKNTSRLIAK
jgi:hypothetical protein